MNLSPEDVLELLRKESSQQILVRLHEFLHAGDTGIIIENLKNALTLFLHFINLKNACVDKNSINDSSRMAFIIEMNVHYEEFKSLVVNYLGNEIDQIQKAALGVLMCLIRNEGKYTPVEVTSTEFPIKFTLVVRKLIELEFNASNVINHFKYYLVHNDVRLYLLKEISMYLETHRLDSNERHMHNLFSLMCKIPFRQPIHKANSENLPCLFINTRADSEGFVFKHKAFKFEFSKVWVHFLKKKLSTALRKKVLLYLPKRVLPHLRKPLCLTDFFTDSYNKGGVLSLLALSGIFFLMEKYNLEYPDFYKQLYALFDIDIIRSKYSRRFFDSAYKFLTSALLPEYIVAAFMKRLARLSLYAPTHVLLIIIPFIGNLLIRHPSLKVLINDQHETSVKEDPFRFEELDFEKCNAMQSSLWEIKSLQIHWHPDVAKKASCINSELRPIEWDLTAPLDMDFVKMVKKEERIKPTQFPLSIDFF